MLDRVKRNTSLEVRIEPFNANVVYVNVGDRWVAAVGTNSRWLSQRTYREVEIARREEQRIKQLNAKQNRLSPNGLKNQMRPLRPEDFDPVVAAQQAEIRALNERMGMVSALYVPPSTVEVPAANDGQTTRHGNLIPTEGTMTPSHVTASERAESSRDSVSEEIGQVAANEDDIDDELDRICNLR